MELQRRTGKDGKLNRYGGATAAPLWRIEGVSHGGGEATNVGVSMGRPAGLFIWSRLGGQFK